MFSRRRSAAGLVVVALLAAGVGVSTAGGIRTANSPGVSRRFAAGAAIPTQTISSSPGPALFAGAGRADITPPTGYYMMGWVRSDGQVTGQHTRLYARVIVLKRGGTKVALISEDLNGIAGGMLAAAAGLDKDLGYSERNVLDSASHTHAAPTSYFNFATYNTVFPTLNTPTKFDLAGTLDPVLYAFEVRQLALAIRRADADLAPAALGWGRTTLLGLTANRSLEAHLANYGIHEAYGTGTVSQDPGGYPNTIDPAVNVLRVDHLVGSRHVPIGIWSTFADHGTVNKFQFHFYNADHHGSAIRVVEAALRASGGAPISQDVVAVYGNSDEGDISAGLTRDGPAAADYVGRVEAASFLSAWESAGRAMTTTPVLAERWTRVCFCGQPTAQGPADTKGVFGLAQFTGSEEGRGPAYDITHVPFEGDHLPAPIGPQGEKIPVTEEGAAVPKAVPLVALRIADEVVVSVPGEMTTEMGRRLRKAVSDVVAGHGIAGIVISGLANEYLDYFTTPEEFDAQHYEGGATVYGKTSALVLEQSLVELAGQLVRGRAATPAYPYDPRNGVALGTATFPSGASTGAITAQPATTVARLGHPTLSWQGGPRGEDRPVDAAFVVITHQVGARWQPFDSDLGLAVLWSVDDNGVYTAYWEAPISTPIGSYRFEIHASHYRLTSAPFVVSPTAGLTAVITGRGAVTLRYPAPVVNVDLTARPAHSGGGNATFMINAHPIEVVLRGGAFRLSLHAGDRVALAAGAARDEFGNSNANALNWTF